MYIEIKQFFTPITFKKFRTSQSLQISTNDKMSDYKIEKLEELLKKTVGNGASITDVKASILGGLGENYGGELLKLEISLKNGIKTQVIHAVGKRIPALEFFQKVFNIQVTFRKEIAYYEQIIPALQEFQKEQGVEEVLNFFPKLYGSRINLNGTNIVDRDALILLEDLKAAGFSNLDRRVGYNYESALITLKDLAELHATAIALKLKKPKIFEKLKVFCRGGLNPPPNQEDPSKSPLISLVWESENCVPFVPKVKENFKTWMPEFANYVVREPFATISHGDMWVNNTMLRFEDGKPVESKFIDFQIYEYKSPVMDLLFFLFTSVQQETLELHLDDLLKYYHEHFQETLIKLHCHVHPFRFAKFLSEIKIEAPRLFSMVLGFTVFVVHADKALDPDQGFDISEQDGERLVHNMSLATKRKVWYIVQEFAIRGWL